MKASAIGSSLLLLTASPCAQTTWIVDADGRPGTNFTSLPAAVAAAQAGDTLRVRASSMGLAYDGFSTSKGLNIVSDGAVLVTFRQRVEVTGLPAGETFRFAGFYGPRKSEFGARFADCQGVVQVEDVHAVEYGFMFPSAASIEIRNCALVSMINVENFGTPAVQIDGSRAVLTRCLLGVTSINIGGGPAVHGTGSTIDIVEPAFNAAFNAAANITPIVLTDCVLRLSGTAASYVQGGVDRNNVTAPAVMMTRGSARIDPLVRLNPFRAGTPIGGTGTVVFGVTPSVSVVNDQPGATMTVTHVAGVGDTIAGILGLPAVPYPTSFGEAMLAPNLLVTTVITSLSQRVFTQAIPVPATLPEGVGLTVQDAVLNASGLTLGVACPFVVH
jgi:hypothetical protein